MRFILCLILFTSPAWAAEKVLLPQDAAPAKIDVTLDECRQFVAHFPSTDIEYKAGEDAYGRKVTPAEGDFPPEGNAIVLPDKIQIDISVLVQPRVGVPNDPALYSPEAILGRVFYDQRSGSLIFNGQKLQSNAQHAVIEACEKLLQQKVKAPRRKKS